MVRTLADTWCAQQHSGVQRHEAYSILRRMTFPRQTRLSAVLVMVVCAAAVLDAGQNDVVTRARGLAGADQRGEAIALLQESVAVSPRNSDARVFLGTLLSWEGRYAEARTELEAVLTESPTHGDALPASINVELWSGHPERAEALARRGLRQRPADPNYLLARARALVALKRSKEARDVLERLLAIEPRNEQALQMRRSLEASLRLWQMRVGAAYDAFSDHRVAWREWQASVSRTTPVGSILVRGSRAERFGLKDDQIEFEAYPRLRPGTYAYVAGAYSPNAVLYPQYRYAADLYQGLGAGFEGSAGFRRLGFGRGVNIYAGSLSKYYGNWLFTGRLFVTPDSAGTSRSIHGSFRRYFGDGGTFVGLRYSRGGWREELRNRNDLEVLDSNVGVVETTMILGGHLELNVTGSYSRENRVEQRDLRQYSVSTGLGFRF
jgi:YaiO family outer membrane protein